jgi:hypothetical protein
MEKTKAYRSLLKGGVTLCVVFLMLFLSMLYSNNFWPLLISIGLLGMLLRVVFPGLVAPPTSAELCDETLIDYSSVQCIICRICVWHLPIPGNHSHLLPY